MRVGIEVGGTFTDLVAIEDGQVRVTKVPSVPMHPDEGAIAAVLAGAIDLRNVIDLVHGSTVATNAILERKGAKVAFIVTAGFRDILFLQRHLRRQIYDLFYKKPTPVVERSHVIEINERMGANGEVVKPVDDKHLTLELLDFLSQNDFGAVAICFLNSYANEAHERCVEKIIRKNFPSLPVTCSCDVTREFREYERASTTTLAAYVQPVIDSYLSRFEGDLSRRGFGGKFSIMQSNGGRLPVEAMSRNAITSLFSGPAAGVMGAVRQAGFAGYENLITLDMGGTSTDVCLVADGVPQLTSETEVDGLPIRTPVLDIVTVGAGGGSIIWSDDGGMLRVGPESAGADPGPICYGRGGTRPAITDAHMVRGTVRAEAFLGGRMRVDREPAYKALADIADEFKMSPEQLADSAVRVADSNIVRAIQLVSTERGRDPRDYVLVPFGGAGPLHAARVADELGIATIVVPPNAGVLSAYGLLASDFSHYGTLTRRLILGDGIGTVVRDVFSKLRQQAEDGFRQMDITGPINLSYTLDMRFVGQAFEVPVELSEVNLENLSEERLLELFNEAHYRVFAFGESGLHRAEIVSFRLGASVSPDLVPSLSEGPIKKAVTGVTKLFDQGTWYDCPLLTRGVLMSGEITKGPALLEDDTSTIFVPSGWQASADDKENIIIRREG